jgi:hypothetical protein
MSAASKPPIYGPEPWQARHATVWSYWDLWFCVVALVDHDGDLDALAEAIEEGGRLSGGGTAEAKLSHLDDLKRRLAAAGIDAETLVAGEDTDPKIRAKARTKALRQGLYPRDMTEPMWHTPRERFYERALRGRWNVFPVSPEPFHRRATTVATSIASAWRIAESTIRATRSGVGGSIRSSLQRPSSRTRTCSTRRSSCAMCVASQPASASASETLQIRNPVWLRISRRWFLIWRPAKS